MRCCNNECRQGRGCPRRVDCVDITLYLGAVMIVVMFAILGVVIRGGI
jgi:hypothetical protein